MSHLWHIIKKAISGHSEHRFRYGARRNLTWQARYWRAFEQVIITLFFGLIGFWIATAGLNHPPGQHPAEALWMVLYWPVLFGQVVTSLNVLASTTNTIDRYRHNQAWDTLRTTPRGIAFVLRTEWVGVFQRLRPILVVLILARIVLIAAIFYHLATTQTVNLSYLIQGIVPTVTPFFSLLLLVCLMTASILLPLTTTGLDAAIGLLVAVYFSQRLYAVIVQLMLSLSRLLLVGGLAFAMIGFVNGDWRLADGWAWLLASAFTTLGDWGLALLNLEFSGLLWATIPYGIFIGAGLLFLALLQAFLADWVLALAIRQAQTRE
jgi:hypothetical protein